MRDIIEIVGPAIGITFIFLITFGYFAFVRYLRYKETIELAKQGLLHPSREQRNGNGRDTLRWGVILVIMSIGFFMGFALIMKGVYFGRSDIFILLGILPLFFGIALLIIHRISGSKSRPVDENRDEPDPIPPHKL